MWICRYCKTQNNNNFDKCSCCGNPRSKQESNEAQFDSWNCQYCGAENYTFGAYCSVCGKSRQPKGNRNVLLPIIAGISVIALCAVILLVFFSGKSKYDMVAIPSQTYEPQQAISVQSASPKTTIVPTPKSVSTPVPVPTWSPTPTPAPTPTPTQKPIATPTPPPVPKYDFLSILPANPVSYYGKTLKYCLQTGDTAMTDEEKTIVDGDTYEERKNSKGAYKDGYSGNTIKAKDNSLGYKISFYYADNLVYFAIVYDSNDNPLVKLHYWGDKIVGYRDYRSDHQLRYTNGYDYDTICAEFGTVFDIGMGKSW